MERGQRDDIVRIAGELLDRWERAPYTGTEPSRGPDLNCLPCLVADPDFEIPE
jgi:hypothetical protein